MVLNDIIRSLSVIGVRGSFDIWLLLKRIKTKSQMKLTFKFNSIYADFGMFVAAFVAIRGGRGGTFSVSIVSFFSTDDYFSSSSASTANSPSACFD